jgi:signal transduction histidine kinase
VLRREDEDLALAPQPTLAHLSTLVRRARASGLPVAVDVQDAGARPLGAGVDLTAYRVIQEALRSARDAGQAGSARVLVRYGAEDVEVEVADDGPQLSGRRRRLLGMRERVALYGGELETVPAEGGGYRVRARLPLARASA